MKFLLSITILFLTLPCLAQNPNVKSSKETQNIINESNFKKKLLQFTKKEIEDFLKETEELGKEYEDYSNLKYCAFAYEFNDGGHVFLCLNTEKEFKKQLKEGAQYYTTDEAIESLNYSTGNWDAREISEIWLTSLISKDEDNKIEEIYKKYHSGIGDELMNKYTKTIERLITETLIEFEKTDTYNKINKTKNFISFTINYGEDSNDVKERMKKYK